MTCKTYHSVRDLTAPERDEGSKWEAGLSLVSSHSGNGSSETSGEGSVGGGLDLNLNHLHWAKSNVGKELSRGGSGKPKSTTVLDGLLLANEGGIVIFENLVEAKLAEALKTVANQSWGPSLEKSHGSLLSSNGAHAADKATVLAGVHLHVALGDIKGSDEGVGKSAAKNTTDHALAIVGVGVGDGMREAGVPLALFEQMSSRQ